MDSYNKALKYLICMKYLYVYDDVSPRFTDLNSGSRDEEPCEGKDGGGSDAWAFSCTDAAHCRVFPLNTSNVLIFQ